VVASSRRTPTTFAAPVLVVLHRVTFTTADGLLHSLLILLPATPRVGDKLTVEGTRVVVTAVSEGDRESTTVELEARPEDN
jgi:hypothetical protein